MGVLLTEIEELIVLATENGQYFPCGARPSATAKLGNGLRFGGLTLGLWFPASDRLEWTTREA